MIYLDEILTLHVEGNGLPVIRGGVNGRGPVLLSGSALITEDPQADAEFIRLALKTRMPVYIEGRSW